MTLPPALFDLEDDYPVVRMPPVASRVVRLRIVAIERPPPQPESFEVEDAAEMAE